MLCSTLCWAGHCAVPDGISTSAAEHVGGRPNGAKPSCWLWQDWSLELHCCKDVKHMKWIWCNITKYHKSLKGSPVFLLVAPVADVSRFPRPSTELWRSWSLATWSAWRQRPWNRTAPAAVGWRHLWLWSCLILCFGLVWSYCCGFTVAYCWHGFQALSFSLKPLSWFSSLLCSLALLIPLPRPFLSCNRPFVFLLATFSFLFSLYFSMPFPCLPHPCPNRSPSRSETSPKPVRNNYSQLVVRPAPSLWIIPFPLGFFHFAWTCHSWKLFPEHIPAQNGPFHKLSVLLSCSTIFHLPLCCLVLFCHFVPAVVFWFSTALWSGNASFRSHCGHPIYTTSNSVAIDNACWMKESFLQMSFGVPFFRPKQEPTKHFFARYLHSDTENLYSDKNQTGPRKDIFGGRFMNLMQLVITAKTT